MSIRLSTRHINQFGAFWRLACVLIPGVHFAFTPYALLSALFWVPGGWLAIASVQYAGLGISQATWSSFIVVVSFVSGIAIFHEPVQSWPVAAVGLLGMVVSIAGMAFFSDPARAQRRAAKLPQWSQQMGKMEAPQPMKDAMQLPRCSSSSSRSLPLQNVCPC